jgi:hypothetical protein
MGIATAIDARKIGGLGRLQEAKKRLPLLAFETDTCSWLAKQLQQNAPLTRGQESADTRGQVLTKGQYEFKKLVYT